MNGMKCGKKSAQKLISEFEESWKGEKKNILIDWLLKKNLVNQAGNHEMNERWMLKKKIMIINEVWTDTIWKIKNTILDTVGFQICLR